MKKHIKNYYLSMGLVCSDEVFCEQCGALAVDIHHCHPKGMGGSKDKDNPENLIALCRICHTYAHNNNTYEHKAYLTSIIRMRYHDDN